jgi:hypothetical protein
MDNENFVLTTGSNGEIMAGGYIINSRLLVPSMSGGSKSENASRYAIPAGLYYTDIPYSESSVSIMYENYDVLPDNIYDNLYESATFKKSIDKDETIENQILNENNIKKSSKKITKKRKIKKNPENKKSRKQK